MVNDTSDRLDVIKREVGSKIYDLWRHLGRQEFTSKGEERAGVPEEDYVRNYVEKRFTERQSHTGNHNYNE